MVGLIEYDNIAPGAVDRGHSVETDHRPITKVRSQPITNIS